MKYDKETIGVKEYLTQNEYQTLVSAMVNIQFIDDPDGSGSVAYHPEYATMAMPSIVAHTMLTGVEFDETEDMMYDAKLVEQILADDFLRDLICNRIIFGRGNEYPDYYFAAEEDARKVVEHRLELISPLNMAINKINVLFNDMVSLFQTLKPEEIKALAEALVTAQSGESDVLVADDAENKDGNV